MAVQNRFVDYLTRFYTGEATHEGVFDEYNLQENDRAYEDLLHVTTTVESKIISNFLSENPTSIILTGNAGDGKTRICRAVVEKLEGRPLMSWPVDGQPYVVETPSYTLHVIKDLSDFDANAAREILTSVASAVEGIGSVRYLIAANEGKLRHTSGDLKGIESAIAEQLEQGVKTEGTSLRIYNLNLEATSAYVPQLLTGLTGNVEWADCDSCPALSACPIRANRERLADSGVQARMAFLYEVIEQSGTHITVRDMLIHLTHTLAGTLTCEDVQKKLLNGQWEPWQHAYYNNAFALTQNQEHRRTLHVVKHLSRLQIGDVSCFDVDHFILLESSVGHQQLFGRGVDMGGLYFDRLRKQYLEGHGQTEGEGHQHKVLEMLPHARRKLIFEWSNEEQVGNLMALKTVRTYRDILKLDAKMATKRVVRDLILGLNRAFSGIYLTYDDSLFVTAHLTGAAETQVPLIKAQVGKNELQVQPFPAEGTRRVLHLCLHKESNAAPVLEIDQLLFEYLVRLAQGGTVEVLEAECGLRIRDYKDRLLSFFAENEEPDSLSFFVEKGNGYRQWEIMLNGNKLTLNEE